MTLRKTLPIILIILGFLIAVWGRFTLLAGLPFFIVGVIINFTTDRALWAKLTWTVLPSLFWLPSMLGFWFLKNETISMGDTYIFPKNFHGEAIIAFGLSRGDTVTISNGRRVFTFDTSRVLITKAEAPRGIADQKFFYADKSGQLTQIPIYAYMQNTKENNDSTTTKVFGWHEKGTTGTNDCSYRFIEFKLCSLAELNTIDNGFKSWKLHDRIKQVGCAQ